MDALAHLGPYLRLGRDLLVEGTANVLLGAAMANHKTLGLTQPCEAGDRLRRYRPGERLPILFCHGYFGDPSGWAYLRRALAVQGFRSQAAVWLWPFWRSCAEYARLVERRAREVLAWTGAPALDLVAHSMGGVVARRFLHNAGLAEARVRRLVTLGSPHRGTSAARLGPGACAIDMRPGSAFLRGIDGDLETMPPRTVLSIHGDRDIFGHLGTALVPPPQENLLLPGLGHGGLLFSPRVARAVAAALPAPVTPSDRNAEGPRLTAAVSLRPLRRRDAPIFTETVNLAGAARA